MKFNRTLFTEAALLIAASCLLGFGYTYFSKKGFFSEKKEYSLEIITFEKSVELFKSGNSLFIDSRHEYEYRDGHIKGALNIPLNEFDTYRAKLSDVPPDRNIVIYCDGAECNSSMELSIKLARMGFANLNIFFGGWQEWKSNRMPVEK
jgi:rhodanese-related sulfurtransferase